MSSKQPQAPSSNPDNPLAALGGMTPEQLMMTRLALDFLLDESKRAPADIEYIYRAFCDVLELPADYRAFQRHYLHMYTLKTYERIHSWLPTVLNEQDPQPMRIKFWRFATRLIHADLMEHKQAPTLSTMIRGLGFLPTIIQRAYPAIQNPVMKQKVREAL